MVPISIHHVPKLRTTIVLIILLIGTTMGYCQEVDSLAVFKTTPPPIDTTVSPEFKAHVGLGMGMFAFKGDVGKNYSNNNPLVSNLGYQLVISAPVSSYLDFTFNTLFGKLTVNERSNTRNLNFQTQIRGGGVGLSYNFKNLLGNKRAIYPYVSLGVSSFEFLSKTDLYDGNGNLYNYWSDGTIRDLAQTDPNALNAEIITQDYQYETDLRELNLDNIGDYKERTFSYPIGIGIQMPLYDKVNLNIGTSLYFNQTDLIDNVTGESIGNRIGDTKNDRFLFTNFSLTYDISTKDKTKEDLLNEDLLADLNESDREDEDKDGVYDIADNCPHTPSYAKVDEHGCPIDSDHDFIPNYKDKELMTKEKMEVDTFGIALGDDYFLQVFDNYQKMWGSPNIVKSIVYSGEDPMDFSELKKVNEDALAQRSAEAKKERDISIHNRDGQFHVVFSASKDGLTKEQSMFLLSIPDIKVQEIGDSSYYCTKSYDELEDAILRQMSLFIDGVSGRVAEIRNDNLFYLNNETQRIQDDILHAPELINKESRGVTFRVQLGAFASDKEIRIYDYLDDVVKLKGGDGLTRYLSGSFKDPKQAAKHKVDLLAQGFTGAFVSAYKDGKRVELEDVGMEVVNKIDYDKLWNEVNTDAFDTEYLEYRVLLGKFEGKVPPRMVNKFITLGDVTPLRYKRYVYYLKGHYKTFEEAKMELEQVIKNGMIAAEVVGEYKGKIISKDEVEMILELK